MVVLTAAILATFALLAWRDIENRYAAARQGLDTTWFIGRNVAERFHHIDRELDALAQALGESGAESLGRHETWERMAHIVRSTPHVRSMGLSDALGRIVQSSEKEGGYPGISVADREYQRRLLADPGQGVVIIPPFKSRIHGELVVGLARAIRGRGGRVLGTAVITVAPSAFDLFASLPNLPRDSAIAIHRRDGINLFRAPVLAEQLGQDLSGTTLFAKALPESPSGYLFTPPKGSVVDGTARLLAYRALDEWPLVVVVGIRKDEITAGWLHDWGRNGVLVGMALIGFSWLALAVQRQATGRLEAELRFSRQELVTRAKVESELRHWASTDPLTGIANRRFFIESLDREFERAQRYGRPLGVLVLDVDLFKSVNDRFGHAAGDEALKIITRVSVDCLRESDLLGRLGGEEFGVLLPETGLAGTSETAERLRAAVAAATFIVDGEARPLSVSIGCAVLDGDADLDRLLARADKALYRAKAGGRNQVTVEPPDPHPPH
ncbi:putative Diguanylate cyclase [Magnetospirillum sp. UT-4]|nr:putative Diguanylate cyclase [Magnetospirillum sp. UT-4]